MHSIADYFLEVLMGRFLNPDNGAFSEAVNSEIYIDNPFAGIHQPGDKYHIKIYL